MSDSRADAIAAVIAAQDEAWCRGDAAAFSAGTTADVVFTNIVGMFVVGREGFQGQHAHIFSTIYKGSLLKQAIAHIAYPRPDVAIVDTVAEVTGFHALPPGIQAPGGVLTTRLEQVMVEEAGAWRVAAFHNVPVSPDAGPPPR